MSAFPYNNSTIEVIALKDIEEGEEVNLCYLDDADGMDVKARKEALRDFYLFHCQCDRCNQEERDGPPPEDDDEEEEEGDHDHDHDDEEEEEEEVEEPPKRAKRKRADD